jgi:monooxygenase
LEEGIDRHIRYRHRIVRADWSTDDARWTVTVERGDPETGPVETVELTCSWLYSCTGYYRYDRGYVPDFEGMADFRGTIVHPQAWPEDFDHAGKRVVVIGSGATAITLVPAMAPDAAHVTMLQRSPTYVASLPRTNPLTRLLRRVTPDRFRGPVLKWANVTFSQAFYTLSRRRPDLVKRVLRKRVSAELPAGYDVDRHFSPRYDPWDQRLCVVTDGDLFAGIRDGSIDVVTDHVDRFTESGIRLRSGDELTADVVVTATGLDLLFLGGIELTVDGEKVDAAERLAYKGMMLEGVPNLSMAVGYTNASWTLKADLTAQYTCRVLGHLRRTGAAACTPVNRHPDVERRPLLGLSSGYVVRSADRFPQQGSQFPWQMYQSYFADRRALRATGFDDALEFTGSRAGTPAVAPG